MEQALILTVLGMVTVLVVLYAINLMIVVMGRLFEERKLPSLPQAPVPPALAAPSPAANDDSDELVAVITAAIASCLGRTSSLMVRPLSGQGNAWAAAARSENTQK